MFEDELLNDESPALPAAAAKTSSTPAAAEAGGSAGEGSKVRTPAVAAALTIVHACNAT